eukprot:Phypoly_transcript_16145.p1 GENE.Phypoly_transcript_16145~~Phypoly_transcript_16145.p1  ORF type:complete len:238 (+),score=33.66 Phypoly_transcript_16145:57-770(+)
MFFSVKYLGRMDCRAHYLVIMLALAWISAAHPHPKPDPPPFNPSPTRSPSSSSFPPPVPSPSPSPAQDHIDHTWITLAHQIGVAHNPTFPFGAAIVDSRNNSLLCVSTNQIQNGNAQWSKFSAHGEMVALENCTNLYLPDVDTISKGNNPEWKYMTLYSNVEPCPMCAQAIIWRGVRRTVFGARASVLARTKCWAQSQLTFREVVAGSSNFAPFQYVRGPLVDLEMAIVSAFPSACP